MNPEYRYERLIRLQGRGFSVLGSTRSIKGILTGDGLTVLPGTEISPGDCIADLQTGDNFIVAAADFCVSHLLLDTQRYHLTCSIYRRSADATIASAVPVIIHHKKAAVPVTTDLRPGDTIRLDQTGDIYSIRGLISVPPPGMRVAIIAQQAAYLSAAASVRF